MIFAKDLDPNKVALYIAIISALAAILGPVVLVLVTSLKRIREASERAAHNTQPNGEDGTPPSPYDHTLKNQEYVIGQIHALQSIVLETRDIALDAKEATALNAAALEAHNARLEQVAVAFDTHITDVEGRVVEATELATKIVTRVNGRLDALERATPPHPPSPAELPPAGPPTATTPPPAPEAESE